MLNRKKLLRTAWPLIALLGLLLLPPPATAAETPAPDQDGWQEVWDELVSTVAAWLDGVVPDGFGFDRHDPREGGGTTDPPPPWDDCDDGREGGPGIDPNGGK